MKHCTSGRVTVIALVRCIVDFLSGILLSLLGTTPIKWSYKDASNRIKPAFESSDTLH